MKDYTFKEKIDIANRITFGATILISVAGTLVIGTFLFKLLWSWTIPELFPAAVEQGLITGDITWLTAMKITGLVAVLTSAGQLISGGWQR